MLLNLAMQKGLCLFHSFALQIPCHDLQFLTWPFFMSGLISLSLIDFIPIKQEVWAYNQWAVVLC